MKLNAVNLTKDYGNFTALNRFTYEFTAGVYGLLGPNGAGKSTLMNNNYGQYQSNKR
ncbi:ATP-binding cassette domain-containing protein [Porcipelethomonas sp.]|uniref:ATP-binding cassette domain-containing protein n=1 Tax=Porcipelethomonas sp. TaxID=2981675 RepID=UPI003077B927